MSRSKVGQSSAQGPHRNGPSCEVTALATGQTEAGEVQRASVVVHERGHVVSVCMSGA